MNEDDIKKPMTYDEHEALLIQISNANGDVGSLTEALQRLRDNYRETTGSYSELESTVTDMSERYKKLEKQNLDLFMRVSASDKKEDENKDIEKDSDLEDLSYESLFNDRQGG